jgi:hypothetical protein
MTEPSATPTESLVGAVDLHIHSAPDVFPRTVTSVDAAREAKAAGLAAIVLKSHSTDTASRATLAADLTGFPTTFGGVALNVFVGGFNPYAVSESVRQGGRVVWMPTITSAHFVRLADASPMLKGGIPPGLEGLRAVDAGGRLLPEVVRILEIVAEHDLVLCSGHLSPEETGLLFGTAVEMGVRRLVVTHPNAPFVGMPLDVCREMVALGAYLEWTPQQSMAERAEAIRSTSIERSIVSTDAGSMAVPRPVQLLTEYLAGLRAEGFTDAELYHLSVAAPSHVLGLPGHETAPTLADSERAAAVRVAAR